MKQYNDSFRLWQDIQDGKLNASFVDDGIWSIVETDTGDKGFVFSDESEMFYPHIYETFDSAVKGRSHYCKTML